MMDFTFFFRGILVGLAIAVPVGPIGILCIRKTISFGRLSGLFSGPGAAFADTIYGAIATFGLTLISDFLMAGEFWLRLLGGCFLICLGIKTFFAKPRKENLRVSHKTFIRDFISTFFLTLTNPMTFLFFIAVFATFGLANTPLSYPNAAALVIGILVGSALWWLILSEGVTLFRKRLSQEVMAWINRIAGLLIIGFGILAWISG